MGFWNYYINRYIKNMLLWKLLVTLSTIALCLGKYPSLKSRYYDGCCAKDALIIFSYWYIVPMLVLICTISFLLITYKDINSNILLRYGSKQKIWMYQSLSAIVYNVENVLNIYITALIFGYLYFGSYDVWQVNGSLFNRNVTRYNLPEDIGLSDGQLYLIMFLVKVFIFSMVCVIGLFIEYITSELILAILGIGIMCALDFISGKFLIGSLDIHILDFYNVSECVTNIVIAALITAVFVIAGRYICVYRQYYKKAQ